MLARPAVTATRRLPTRRQTWPAPGEARTSPGELVPRARAGAPDTQASASPLPRRAPRRGTLLRAARTSGSPVPARGAGEDSRRAPAVVGSVHLSWPDPAREDAEKGAAWRGHRLGLHLLLGFPHSPPDAGGLHAPSRKSPPPTAVCRTLEARHPVSSKAPGSPLTPPASWACRQDPSWSPVPAQRAPEEGHSPHFGLTTLPDRLKLN